MTEMRLRQSGQISQFLQADRTHPVVTEIVGDAAQLPGREFAAFALRFGLNVEQQREDRDCQALTIERVQRIGIGTLAIWRQGTAC